MSDALPIDYPVLQNPSFVLYSKATGLTDAQVSAGYTPPSRGGCVGSVSSRTGFASVSGGYNSADLKIIPQLDGSFSITAYRCSNMNGERFALRASFTATFTTNGQSEVYGAGTKTFTFRVIVLSRDYPYFGDTFRELKDGKAVNEKKRYSPSIAGYTLDDVSAYVGGELLSFTSPRYRSGLTVRRSPDEGDVVTYPVYKCDLLGTTSRIGVYACGLYAKSRQWAGGTVDPGTRPPNEFPFGEFTTPLILSVYTDWMPGDLVFSCPSVQYSRSTSSRRLLYHNLTDHYSLQYLINDKNGVNSAWSAYGNGWRRRVEEVTVGTQSIITYVWQYTIEKLSSSWQLRVEYWMDIDGEIDEGSRVNNIVDSAVAIEGATTAPVKWSHTWWQGDTACWMNGYGFFSQLGENVMQQEAIYTRPQGIGDEAANHAGWGSVFPPVLQYSSGIIARKQPDGTWLGSNNVTLNPQSFDNDTCMPYAPPRLDDRAIDVMSISNDAISNANAIGYSGVTGAAWSRYPLRRFFPLNLSGTATVHISHTDSADSPGIYCHGQWLGGETLFTHEESFNKTRHSYNSSMTMPIDALSWSGSQDKIVERMFGAPSSCTFSVSSYSVNSGSDYIDEYYPSFNVDRYIKERTDVSGSASGAHSHSGLVEVVPADGRECIDGYRKLIFGTAFAGLVQQPINIRTQVYRLVHNDYRYPEGRTDISDTTTSGTVNLSDVLCSIKPSLYGQSQTITHRKRTASFGPGSSGGAGPFIDFPTEEHPNLYVTTYQEQNDTCSGSLTLETIYSSSSLQSGYSSYSYHQLKGRREDITEEDYDEETGESITTFSGKKHYVETTVSGTWDGKTKVVITTTKTLDKEWSGGSEPPDNWVIVGPTTVTTLTSSEPFEDTYNAKEEIFKSINTDYKGLMNSLDLMNHDDCEAFGTTSGSSVNNDATTTTVTITMNI